jgi:hypothetical protein
MGMCLGGGAFFICLFVLFSFLLSLRGWRIDDGWMDGVVMVAWLDG